MDKTRVNDLLILERELINCIHSEIDNELRGRGRELNEIRESLLYRLNDRFYYMNLTPAERYGYLPHERQESEG